MAYSGGRQDGPYTGPRRGVRERRFRGGRPQRAVLEADTAATISDEADEANEPDQPPALGDPLLRQRRHVPRVLLGKRNAARLEISTAESVIDAFSAFFFRYL